MSQIFDLGPSFCFISLHMNVCDPFKDFICSKNKSEKTGFKIIKFFEYNDTYMK